MKLPPKRSLPKSYLSTPASLRPNISAKQFQLGLEMQSEVIAQEFLETLIENIRGNKYGFHLDDQTVKRRGYEGNEDETPLIDQGYLIDSLVRYGSIVTVKDGIHPRGLEYLELAMILEYGRKDKKIPAFPVGRFTFRDFEKRAEELLMRFLNANKE
jgi:hypothetical protein